MSKRAPIWCEIGGCRDYEDGGVAMCKGCEYNQAKHIDRWLDGNVTNRKRM